jgi:hypothetical protein
MLNLLRGEEGCFRREMRGEEERSRLGGGGSGGREGWVMEEAEERAE